MAKQARGSDVALKKVFKTAGLDFSPGIPT